MNNFKDENKENIRRSLEGLKKEAFDAMERGYHVHSSTIIEYADHVLALLQPIKTTNPK